MSATARERERIDAYLRSPDEVLAALGTDVRNGLSGEQALERLEQYGRNALTAEARRPAWRKFLDQFTDVLVVLLIIAAAISARLWLYERETALPYEAMAILAIVLLNALMGYVQESRAEQAVAALRQMSAKEANVATSFSSKRVTPFQQTGAYSSRRRYRLRKQRSLERVCPCRRTPQRLPRRSGSAIATT